MVTFKQMDCHLLGPHLAILMHNKCHQCISLPLPPVTHLQQSLPASYIPLELGVVEDSIHKDRKDQGGVGMDHKISLYNVDCLTREVGTQDGGGTLESHLISATIYIVILLEVEQVMLTMTNQCLKILGKICCCLKIR